MDPERFQEVKRVFHLALEKDDPERQAVVDEACAGDDELRAEVLSLLASHAGAEEFIEEPAVSHDRVRDLFDEDSMVGRRIGRYRLLFEIDRGGMGSVYAAASGESAVEPEAAIKLLHRHFEELHLQGRLRQEWRILGRLNHPNIARLLDTGTTETGRPYLVMEYVDGEPLLAYCDRHRLSIAERLRLTAKVCSALDLAHRHSILHRDVKPANILVHRNGEPKLLDFGIAKQLHPERSYETAFATAPGMQFISPDYASPEQVMDRELSAASDIYSLGVVLYELLTGHRPYRITSRSPAEVIRVVCARQPSLASRMVLQEKEVQRSDGTEALLAPRELAACRGTSPAVLARTLRDKLDPVLQKALEKDPRDRYSSVLELADDLERAVAPRGAKREHSWIVDATVRCQDRLVLHERFSQSPIRIGGLADNDLVLNDSHVSGHHGHVVVSSGRLLYRDHSRNGSFVGDQRISEWALKPGAPVSIPPYDVFFELLETDQARRTRARPEALEDSAGAYLHPLAPAALRGRSFRLRGTKVTLGRGTDAEIRLEIGTLSRHHAVLSHSGGRWWLVDLESANGTLVNGRPVDRRHGEPLAVGDRLAFGELQMVFSDRPEPPEVIVEDPPGAG